MATEQKPEAIYVTRNEKMVSQKDGICRVRIARFLKPFTKHVNQAIAIPKTPLLSELFPHNLQQWPSNVSFTGWNCPQIKWKEWVDRLSPKYCSIWIKTGICDAILNSIYEIRCNQDLVLGLSEFWCSHTNTFVFPWGEATVTLEDIMILGGYPVLGEPVSSPLTKESMKIQEELMKHRKEISRSKAKKAGHSGWLKHFMETESEYEHVAFLSLWLSRYVFPSLSEETIGNHVFPIAAKLSQGIQVALAQPLLASLYRDLKMLRKQAMASSVTIRVSGPIQLVQIWAFERFQVLGPKPLGSVVPGEPRVARWHKLNSKLNLPLVRLVLRLPENFQWRPYVANLKNWNQPWYYKENDQQLMVDCSSSDDHEFRSFLRCLKACELVGIDCKEKYFPHRVAMQFGMDQDLPADVSNFDLGNEFVNFFVPSRSFQPGVSMRYSNWWKDMMMGRKKDLLRKRYPKNSGASSAVQTLKHLKSPKKSYDVRKIFNCGESHTSITPCPTVTKHMYEDSSEDNVPIARRVLKLCNQSSYVASSNSSAVDGGCVKRKPSTKSEVAHSSTSCVLGATVASRPTKSKYWIPMSPKKKMPKYGDDSQIGALEKNHSGNGSNAVAKEVKKRGGEALDPLDFMCLSQRIKQRKGGDRESVKGERIKGGESLNNPINVNIYMDSSSSRFHKVRLEERMQRIEKMLRVNPRKKY